MGKCFVGEVGGIFGGGKFVLLVCRVGKEAEAASTWLVAGRAGDAAPWLAPVHHAIWTILDEGGPILWALMALAVMIYTLLFGVWRQLVATRQLVANHAWERPRVIDMNLPWQAKPPPRRRAEREHAAFELDNLAWIDRRIPFLTVLISAAPLLGLLGTVAGMLLTFQGMAGASSGAPIDTISTGISKALLTTQAGLVVAVPAAFVLALIKRRADVTHLELQRQLHTRMANPTVMP